MSVQVQLSDTFFCYFRSHEAVEAVDAQYSPASQRDFYSQKAHAADMADAVLVAATDFLASLSALRIEVRSIAPAGKGGGALTRK